MRQSDEAKRQIIALRQHYKEKQRPEANRNLTKAIRSASKQIESGKSLPAPRPYPDLARVGEGWVKAGSYWVAHTTGDDKQIIAVFYDESDIPNRR